MAQFLGALAILGLVTSGLVKLFSKWNDQIPGILTANGVSLFVATVIAGFGMADGRDPVFGEAFSVYVLPQLAILGVSLWYWSRSKNRSAVPATADAPSNAMPTSEAFPHAKKGSWVKRSAIAVGSFLLLVAVYLGANLIGREAGREGAKMVMAPTQAQKEAASNQGLQEAAVEVRKTLPKKLDEAITLIDVRVSHMRTAYLHEVGADYEIEDIGKVEGIVKQRVCASAMTKSIKQGVSYAYEYWGPSPEKRFWGRFIITSCP